MFDFIRNNNKAIQILLFAFVLPSFLLAGIEGFGLMGEKSETVAVIDGKKISKIEWDAAVKDDIERFRQENPNLDPKAFDTPEFKYASLEQLVKKRLLATAAEKLHLGVSDQKLANELLQNPILAALRLPNGGMDQAKYKELLAPQGFTPQSFEARVRSDLSVRQVLQSLSMSGMVPASVADIALNAYFEKRQAQILKFLPEEFAKNVNPSTQEIEAFYKSNASSFQAPESATVQYVVLDAESIKKTIVVSDVDIKNFYDQNVDKLSGSEERKASHILIAAPVSASTSERAKAKKQAEELLAQLQKSPGLFSDFAKKYSQDTASAANGGDLGFFSRGAMVKPFEDAVFSMQTKQISSVVESDFGYHIIQLNEVKLPQKRSLADVRIEIEAELKKQMVQKKFSEVADLFTTTVYEQSDSLQPVADKLKLEIQTAHNVTRQPASGARGALASNKFLGVLFASDSLEKKRNTEAVELGGNQMVAGRIVNYSPARTYPLEEVKDRVRSMLVAQTSLELARKAGAAKLFELTATSSSNLIPTGTSDVMTVSRDAPQQQHPKLIDAILRVPTGKLPTWIGVDLDADGYCLVRVNQVVPGGEVSATRNRDQYLQVWSDAENTSYYEYLKNKFKVEIKAPKPAVSASTKRSIS